MKLFPYAHASAPEWQDAAGQVVQQLKQQMQAPNQGHATAPALGLLYITDHYAQNEAQTQSILQFFKNQLPNITSWAGTVGVGVLATNVEYFDAPALCVMLCDVPSDGYKLFSGMAPLSKPVAETSKTSNPDFFVAQTALVHSALNLPDASDTLVELAKRVETNFLFGGFSSSRTTPVQFSQTVLQGGVSGVAFGSKVKIISRITQGCQAVKVHQTNAYKNRTITSCDGSLVLTLDGEPALDVLLQDLDVTLAQPQKALSQMRATLVAVTDGEPVVNSVGHFSHKAQVRNILGLNALRAGFVVADTVHVGQQLVLCQRNAAAAKSDLMRICAEIREELESEDAKGNPLPSKKILGAVFVSCAGRGGPHFGAPGAELQILNQGLGDVPLVGFFASSEIAYDCIYGYTGVLTVFVD